ncbi:MAG TPA: hypothetical protein VGQ38_14785 [Gaiellaceae bacterium]|jgi:hypothetical protein|nr:hypothetical protein [Gaiellaceae bacterium]
MHLTFLTPLGALFALTALLLLGALALNERRARRVRRALNVESPPLQTHLTTALLLALVPVLLGLALAQPVLQSTRTVRSRTDAQIFYTFDTSVSMSASTGPGAPTRLDRAVAEASRLRLRLGDVPSGLASMTDRVLPTIFPSTSQQEFAAGLSDTIDVDAPPPKGLTDRATTFAALDTFAGTNFFSPGIPHRLVILFTDGETAPYFTSDLKQALRQSAPKTSFVVVHVSRPGERIYHGSKVDPDYRPDPRSGRATAALASALGGRSFEEGKIGSAAGAARQLLGKGTVARIGVGLHVVALAQWLVLVSLVPILVLLWRRNIA